MYILHLPRVRKKEFFRFVVGAAHAAPTTNSLSIFDYTWKEVNAMTWVPLKRWMLRRVAHCSDGCQG
jgi:hypothetical protein